jgi:hypothetical protein
LFHLKLPVYRSARGEPVAGERACTQQIATNLQAAAQAARAANFPTCRIWRKPSAAGIIVIIPTLRQPMRIAAGAGASGEGAAKAGRPPTAPSLLTAKFPSM